MEKELQLVHGLLIIEASRSHSDTRHPKVLLWTIDQPYAEDPTWPHTTLTRDRYPFLWWDNWLQLFPTSHGATAPRGPRPPHYWSLTITLGRNPLDKWSPGRRDLYLITHNTHKRHTSMPPAGFEPAIPASKRQQTHSLDLAATGISSWLKIQTLILCLPSLHALWRWQILSCLYHTFIVMLHLLLFFLPSWSP
jgi:hypothetical protein